MHVKIKVDLDEANLVNKHLKRSAPFMVSYAMNKVLPRTAKYLKARMSTEIEGGATSWTKRGLQYDKSNYKTTNVASLYFAKDRFFMQEVMHGGRKQARNKRIPEPFTKNIRLTKAGNIPRNFQQQAIKMSRMSGPQISNKTRRTRGIKRNRFEDIWVGTPTTGGPYGIYKNDKRGGPPKLMVMYKRQNRLQKQIWPASKQAEKHFRRLGPWGMNQAFEYVMARRRR
jgi:hypothetical protein